MEIVIYKDKTFFAKDFLDYLIILIKQYLLNSNIDFTRFTDYFQKTYPVATVHDILIQAGRYLEIMDYEDIIQIQINPNVKFKDLPLKLIDLCRLLNYGTLDIQGSYIFSDTFDYVSNNINQIYLNYILGM